MKGTFIVIEGGEGSGKSTQIARLKDFLPNVYPDRTFVFTQEPGGTPLADQVRAIMVSDVSKDANGRTMLGLIMASRSDHVDQLIEPSLSAGKTIVCDRYLASSYAYQITAQESHELERIFWEYAKVLPTPDHTIFLDVTPEVGRERANARESRSHFHSRPADFHTRVREGYRTYLHTSGIPHTIVNADQGLEEVWKEVQKAVQSVL